MSAFTSNKSGDVSVIRFNGLTITDKKFFLNARNSEHELLSNPIPIN
jgi:hypothetical protein